MNRRTFIQQATTSIAVLSAPQPPFRLRDQPMGIVVHSYGNRWRSTVNSNRYPGFADAVDLLTHCHRIGAGGVQVGVNDWSADFVKKVRQTREKLGLYLEGSVGLPKTAGDLPRFEQDVANAREAGATVLRTVCSVGRRYESYPSAEAFDAMKRAAQTSLQWVEPVLRRHKVRLGVENHKDWRAPELAALLKQLDSEWIGVTLDFGNSIALLEDPMQVVRTLAPYVVSTHVKDMAVEEYADGFRLSEVPLGQGILDLPTILNLCRKHNPAVTFTLEMITRDPLDIPCLRDAYWTTFADVPGRDLAQTLRLVRTHKYSTALPRVTSLSAEARLAAEEENIRRCLAYSKDKLAIH